MRGIGNSLRKTTGDRKAVLLPFDLNYHREAGRWAQPCLQSSSVPSLGLLAVQSTRPMSPGSYSAAAAEECPSLGARDPRHYYTGATLLPSRNRKPTQADPEPSLNTEVNFLLVALACRAIINPLWQLLCAWVTHTYRIY